MKCSVQLFFVCFLIPLHWFEQQSMLTLPRTTARGHDFQAKELGLRNFII